MTRTLAIKTLLVFAAATPAFAKEYTFKELALKDYEEMQLLVHKAAGYNVIDDVEREPKVREALKLVLSRENNDGKRSVLFTHLQGQLPEAFFQLSVQKIAEEAISTAKDESASNVRLATAYLILENLLAEVRPRTQDYRGAIEKISEAKLKMAEGLKSYRRLEGMEVALSPSEIAKNFLKDVPATQVGKDDSKDDGIKQKAFAKATPEFFD